MNNGCKNLVCGAGGVLGYSYVGAIETVFTDDDLKGIVNFLGASVGSIFAAVLACRGSKQYLQQRFNNFDAAKLQDDSHGFVRDMYRLITKFGYNKWEYIFDIMQEILVELQCPKNVTLQQVYETFGTNLIITGANVSRKQVCYFNRLTHPDMQVAEAVKISACIPLFFKAHKIDKEYYVDGGVLDGYPMWFMRTDMYMLLNNYNPEIIGYYKGPIVSLEEAERNIHDLKHDVPEDERFLNCIMNRTIGIKAFASRSLNYIDPNSGTNKPKKFNVVSFGKEIIDMLMDTSLKQYIDEKYWARTIRINVGTISEFNFDISDQTKVELRGRGESVQRIIYDSNDTSSFDVQILRSVINKDSHTSVTDSEKILDIIHGYNDDRNKWTIEV